MSSTWTPYGQEAVLVDLDLARAPDRAARTHAAAALLRSWLPAGAASEVIIGAGTLVVAGVSAGGLGAVEASLARLAASAGHDAAPGIEPSATSASPPPPAREHRISVVYDGPDLDETAAALGVSPEEIVALHTGRAVTAELLGFLPGFAYLGDVAPKLVRPRRASPRPIVPAGSVGVAGSFTGIYPFSSPGGWTLLGRAVGVALFDPDRDPPALFAPGDRVRFVALSPTDAPSPPAAPPRAAEPLSAGARALEILSAPPGTTVQDAGRPGQLSKGLSPSGPVDWLTHAAANAAVGNAPGAAALEIPAGELHARACGDLLVSIDGEPAMRLRDGDELRSGAAPRAVRYLAVRGAVAVPARLGARATLLAARLGGFEGRPLRRGDRVPAGDEAHVDGLPTSTSSLFDPTPDDAVPVLEVDAVDLPSHVSRFPDGALDALLTTPWRISRWGDRVGVRLEGGRIPRDGPDLALPVPMLRGAVQVATDGTPIVLGPDHPVTGGYPVLAVVRRGDQPRLARLRPGDSVRFCLGR